MRGKQSKGPTVKHKHKSDVESSSDDEDFEVDNTTGGPTEEGDPTDGLREVVAAITRRLENDDAANHATQPTVTPTAPGIGPEPGPSSSQRSQSNPRPYQEPDNTHVNEPTLSTEDAARIKVLAQCVKNWKAAAEDDKKRMWAIFDEAGVFACACRHGLVLWILDMIRSGEL